MKKIFYLLALVFLTVTSSAQNGEMAKPEVNRFRFSAIQFLNSTLQVEYERMIDESTSFVIAPSMKYRDNDSEEQTAFGVDIQYRFYVYHKERERHSKNLFFAPYGFYKHYNLREECWDHNNYYPYEESHFETSHFDVVGGGVVFGIQYVFAERISVDAYIGGGVRKALGYDGDSDFFMEPGNSGIVPKVGLNIGFSF